MIRTLHYAALFALVASGCAQAPDRDEVVAAVAATEVAVAPQSSGTESGSAAAVPSRIVDINEEAARAPPPVTCRDALKPGSNVIVRQCMTAENWKRFERQEALRAQDLVRTMQRGRY